VDAYMNLQVRWVRGRRTVAGVCRDFPSLSPHLPPPLSLSTFIITPSQLASTEEFVDGKLTGELGEVFIRCNNVLYMRAAPAEEEGGGGGMEA
jgi:small nuclear ribonucleoprotein (snRNP)-like protein